MFNDRKGLEAIWWIIIVVVILMIVAIIVLVGFRKGYGKETKILEEQLSSKCVGGSIQGTSCKEKCADTERTVLGIFDDCKFGLSCCAPRQ